MPKIKTIKSYSVADIKIGFTTYQLFFDRKSWKYIGADDEVIIPPLVLMCKEVVAKKKTEQKETQAEPFAIAYGYAAFYLLCFALNEGIHIYYGEDFDFYISDLYNRLCLRSYTKTATTPLARQFCMSGGWSGLTRNQAYRLRMEFALKLHEQEKVCQQKTMECVAPYRNSWLYYLAHKTPYDFYKEYLAGTKASTERE